MKKLLMFCVVIMLLALSALPAMASTTLEVWKNYTLAKEASTTGDLYAFGGNTTIAGDVTGDLVTAGFNVFLGGETIGQNAFIIADSVHVLSDVKQTLRILGRQIVLSSKIGKDVAVAGWHAVILPKSELRGDLLAFVGSIEVSGKVFGDLRVAGGHVYINGEIIGDTHIIANSVQLGPQAIIHKPLRYSASQVAVIDTGAQVGEKIFTKINTRTRAEQFLPTIWGTLIIIKFVIILLSALVAHGILRNISQRFVVVGVTQFGKSIMRGFLLLVAVPFAIFIGTLTFIAIPFSLFAGVLYGIGIILSLVYAPIIIGSLVFKFIQRKQSLVVNWKTIVLGVLSLIHI